MSFPKSFYSDSPTTFRSPSFGVLHKNSWVRCRTQSITDSPYSFASSRLSSLSGKYSLSPDPRSWGSDLYPDLVEPDDSLHDPDIPLRKELMHDYVSLSRRGLANIGCLTILCAGIIALFVGYPIATYVNNSVVPSSGFNLGGINATGQVPSMGNFGLIDLDTPKEVYTKASYRDGSDWILVFSDEFNTDGRTFYPGDDPYWEAADLHYWATNNLEWYDPAAVTTENGSLVITFSQIQTHDLNFQGVHRNKFCFTGGMFEASVQLPDASNVVGMWPAIWTMGNLGRAGYGATLEGMWPYSYDSCDVGTAPNQTLNGQPFAATVDGDHAYDGVLSYLPGQKLSRCTCNGEDHPGPKHKDGTYVGRAAPEIDMLEAQVSGLPGTGQVSQSAQWAPFNRNYAWDNTTDNMIVTDPSLSRLNTFVGNVFQQATSVVTDTNQRCYELNDGCFSIYGFEYITWLSDNKISWTIRSEGLRGDPTVEISARPVPSEPMYLILNLGMSRNFGPIDFAHLTFPNHLRVDYVRVYQPPHAINIGCNPHDYPTADYIKNHIEAYTNPNLTTWRNDYGQPFPKNSFIESC
ncbi:glycoside hydrolase family 16 protein [Amanita thiersii Skay4041]|uniref:Glycoside hydrolase family 16 protein n=1 Tax=Amanita thiersii Skay4041 TaxID=703135 RepID=A0A2A9NL59_9AGAR|nr:glycoside hydrolase family 16 protein [Amanita thiersii Skay4041]